VTLRAGMIPLCLVWVANAADLSAQWTTCGSGTLLENGDFSVWSDGKPQQWEVEPSSASESVTQASGSGAVVTATTMTSLVMVQSVAAGPGHYVAAVEATFEVADCVGLDNCYGFLMLEACPDVQCTTKTTDFRAPTRGPMTQLLPYQYVFTASGTKEWHLLEISAPAGTSAVRVGWSMATTGTATLHSVCMNKADPYDAVVWAMDRYYSHFGRAASLDWTAAVAAARPDPAVTGRPLAEAVAALTEQLEDPHTYVRYGTEDILGYVQGPAVNMKSELLPLAGATRVPQDGSIGATAATEVGGKQYAYVVIGSLQQPQYWSGSSGFPNVVYETMTASGIQGVILDLRGNQGGQEDLASMISGQFTDQSVVYAQHDYRAGVSHDSFSDRADRTLFPGSSMFGASFQHYQGKVAVLLGPGCMSSCEAMAMQLQALAAREPARFRSFGAATRGASGNPAQIDLSDDTGVVFSTWRAFTSAGTALEGVGVAPDEAVAWPESPTEDVIIAAAASWLGETGGTTADPGGGSTTTTTTADGDTTTAAETTGETGGTTTLDGGTASGAWGQAGPGLVCLVLGVGLR